MIYESLNDRAPCALPGDRVFSVCPGGVLEAAVVTPTGTLRQRPLLALHGIARNTEELYAAFAQQAEVAGRMVVIPHFSAASWPVFQRITRRARPDRALLSLFATLRGFRPMREEPFDIFGFSGGAQLAHRFAMLYPELVGDLHLGAAGWYTFPEAQRAYPYGIGDSTDPRQPWGRRMRSGLSAYLQRSITVYVGERDIARDDNLRSTPDLDRQQGSHRLERARNYVNTLRAQQRAHGLPDSARLVVFPDCGHRFADCAGIGGIAALACARE